MLHFTKGRNDSMNYNPNEYKFYDIKKAPFKIHGLYEASQSDSYVRLDPAVGKNTSACVADRMWHTTGGRLRFRTDSDSIVLKAGGLRDTAYCNGFDFYVEIEGKDIFLGHLTGEPSENGNYHIDSCLDVGKGDKEITVYFPVMGGVKSVEIGLKTDSSVKEHRPYKHTRPMLYYGSSITQGAAVQRGGLTYQAFVSREFDSDFINLGFAEGCKAEDAMTDYICKFDPEIFVLDYDHNTPSAEYLKSTHEKTFLKFRKEHPATPVIIMSKPDFNLLDKSQVDRRIIIMQTYINAVNSGDNNVYFIDGYTMFSGDMREECTVDGCHPNDIGAKRMAQALIGTVRQIYKKAQFGL